VARERAGLPVDASVRRPVHVRRLRRLGRAKNSEDPRALLAASWPSSTDIAGALGLPATAILRMPPITLR
jgi:protease-4